LTNQLEDQKTFDKIYVLDTNIILTDANQVLTIGQNGKNLIVLPETVIDELDNKKSGFGEINYQAREFGRILSDAEVIKTEKFSNSTIMSVVVQGISIDIISLDDYNLNDVDKSILNDRKIIKVAQRASSYYKNSDVILLSNDIMCRTRAISLGVKTEALDQNKENLNHSFIKVLEGINSSHYNVMAYKHISEYDPEWGPGTYCYHFKATDGNEKIAYIVNGHINFIDDEMFNGLSVKPLNVGQKFAMAGMLDERLDICICEALSGSGKTLLALSAGMKMIRQGKYDKIIYIRNSVESVDKAEEVGFLPGLEEKFKIYNYPLFDTLEFIAQKDMRKKDNNQSQKSIDSKVEELIAKYHIETVWNGSIRGRTISNAYVIIDEVQNFAKSSLHTVLSRMDKDSKVVCIGSNRQIDHPYINKYTNGLSVLMGAAKESNNEVNLFGTELDKVVRGKITEFAERIFEKK
jgi:PhoH-like ATPase